MITLHKNNPASEKQPRRQVRVLLVDDHPILRQGVAKLIGDEPDLTICGEAESLPTALRALASSDPDLVILDLSLNGGDGLELCRQIHELRPKLPVLVFSMHDEELYAERALGAGATGYLMKQEPQDRLVPALRRVLAGDVYLSPKISARLLRTFASGSTYEQTHTPPLQRLTDRELQVFRLIGQGQPVRLIADALFLSPKTIEAHKENIKQKLGLHSSNELLQYAIEARVRHEL